MQLKTEEMERFTLRVPVELQIELKVMAARNRRSLNAQIITLLDECVRQALAESKKAGSPTTA